MQTINHIQSDPKLSPKNENLSLSQFFLKFKIFFYIIIYNLKITKKVSKFHANTGKQNFYQNLKVFILFIPEHCSISNFTWGSDIIYKRFA